MVTLAGRLVIVGSGSRLISIVTLSRALCLGGVLESSAMTSNWYELAVHGDCLRLALTCIHPLSGSMKKQLWSPTIRRNVPTAKEITDGHTSYLLMNFTQLKNILRRNSGKSWIVACQSIYISLLTVVTSREYYHYSLQIHQTEPYQVETWWFSDYSLCRLHRSQTQSQ